MTPCLSPLEARVLGCLIEKSITTPDSYPLTLAALTAACNQISNRDPVLQADEKDVVRALDGLREKQWAAAVALAGSRAPKYRHTLADRLALTPLQRAVLCELILRSPQTVGQLRAHAARLAPVSGAAEVQRTLDELMAWPDGPLAVRLARQTGQREERYAHRLCGAPPDAPPAAAPSPEPARVAVMAENERLAALEAQVASLSDALAELSVRFREFTKQFQ